MVGCAFAAASAALWWPLPSAAARLKDIAAVQGVRPNRLTGVGLVVGLDGTGDQTTQTPATIQAVTAMLQHSGIILPAGATMQLNNVAMVAVTAQLPAFARPGQGVDVDVMSIGNAKSLSGGSLLSTALRGDDGQIYAVAQGNLMVGGAGAGANGSKVQINHLAAGRVPGGATVERSVPTPLMLAGDSLDLGLTSSDYATARAVAQAINKLKGAGTAAAVDGRTIRMRVPPSTDERVSFLADIENLDIGVERPAARVVINARTGSVVLNDGVTLGPCAVAHGSLSVTIKTRPVVSQPNALSQGTTVQSAQSDISVTQHAGMLMEVPSAAKLSDVVKALNALGATPMDLQAILDAMKSAGALNATIEVI
ncbi:MAG: flagellar basal body P-ring protein FlgI [Burkholderiales bacterium]|nr:flagellar basal body P-ring protein FlgI [Burkholderiales bacterium]MDE2452485.1 flagellar basal body P-ring protein FlgI [Burkholderiales bacterium]